MHESVRKCLFTIHLKEKILLSHALFRSYLQKNGAEIGDQHYFIRIPICSPTKYLSSENIKHQQTRISN